MVISGDGSSRSKSTMWGWLLVGIGSLVLLGFLFTAFISHLLPPSNYTLIAAIQNDRFLPSDHVQYVLNIVLRH
ncbi:hypothetical protein ERO13_D07G127200v2 [Gossypium hirsutum]|uniref:Uncharacterized protein n=1 Tax=Gossypium darwinii TaxID=34276 RepID=A0A5D2BVW5_GOSDA|nr:hypothetical protein ERO13_D07G127200v2 [Gossypium hirsutum]TYG61397.1 hypothetical protein ES288_D07G144900v1 [Gossypium darwinii]